MPRTTSSTSRSCTARAATAGPRSISPIPGTDLGPAVRRHPRAHPGARRTPRGIRCRRGSPTSTPTRTSAGSPCAGSSRARSARASRSRGVAPTARSSAPRSPSCSSPSNSTRVPVEAAGPGDLVAVAGFEDITIGETLADADDPRPLPVITVDEPALSMTIGINTSPLAGRDGTKLTARQVKNRLEAELVGNVSIRCQRRPTAPTRGRCRRVASCSWPCSSRRCAARGSSSRSASPRS